MLSLILKADEKTSDVQKKHQELFDMAKNYDKDVRVILLSKENYICNSSLRQIAVKMPNHELFVVDNNTTDEEMIAMALFLSQNSDVMLATLNTKATALEEFLKRRKDGYKIIRIRKKTKVFHSIFKVLGNWSYNIGLKVLGKSSDNFAEAEVCYLDEKIVSSICEDMENTRQTRITHVFKQAKSMTLEEKEIFDLDTKNQTMFKYGIWSFLYLLGFIALTTIYPCLNGFVYSWWMIVLIILYVGIGIMLTFLCSKKVFCKRIGLRNRVNNLGEPLFGFSYYYKTGDKLPQKRDLSEYTQIIVKNKIKLKNRRLKK